MKSINAYLGLCLLLTIFTSKAFAYNKTQLLSNALKAHGIQAKNVEVNFAENPVLIPGFAGIKALTSFSDDKALAKGIKGLAVREAFFTIGANQYNCWMYAGPVTSTFKEVFYIVGLQNCVVDGAEVSLPRKLELMSIAYSKKGYRKVSEDEFNNVMEDVE